MRFEVRGQVERDCRALVESLLEDEAAIMVEGPRGSGKSTLLREITLGRHGRVLDLDDPATAALVRLDPVGAVGGEGLLFVDEYQRVPEVLSALKRAVDRDPTPGRFLLAGSVSGRLLPVGTETLTGRVHRLTLLPMSVGEVLGVPSRLLPGLLAGEDPDTDCELARRDYFELVAAGGFPAALRRTGTQARRRWLASYLATVADRDLPDLVDVRHPGALSRLYRLIAEQTSSVANRSRLGERLALNPATARSYLDLLERVHLITELPGWTVGVSAKVARRPKVHVTDTGLGSVAIGLDGPRLASSPAGGGMLETFVFNEVAKQAAVIDEPLRLAHFRDRSGIEVDIIIERADGTIVAIEVKSATSVSPRDASGLRFLRERLGDRFQAGIVLHTGTRSARFDPGLWALPVAALWGGTGT